MSHATFHFHGALNFFLPRAHRNKAVEHAFDWRGSVKDMIESMGVPHPEIDLLVANRVSVDFDYIVQQDDGIDVYPAGETTVIEPKIALRPPFPGRQKFILDQHLGRLAAYLRMMGFDTLYRNDYHDEELAQVSHDEQRVLLTRDVGLLKRSLVIYGYYVRDTNRHKQLVEITEHYQLLDNAAPFKHCMKCNGLLERVEKAAVVDQLPDSTATYYNDFHRCASCQRIYWKGAHYQRMQALIDEIIRVG
jgi:uncharacterized protein